MFSERLPAAHRANAWTLRRDALEAGGRRLLDLSASNPTTTGLSPLREAAEALARVPASAYVPEPRGSLAAREAVAAALADRAPRVSPDDVVLTSGTSESCAHLFRLLADPGGSVLVPAPGYPLFEPIARAEGLRVRHYPLAFDGRWHLDRAAFASAAPGARAVIVVEPNNPTGSCLEPADRAFLEETAERHGLAIVADEVFGDHPHEPGRVLRSWLWEGRVPTFVLGGLSKRCGLPHLKLGWIALAGPPGARAEARAGLEWLADLFLSVGSPVQAALPELLALRAAFTARTGDRLRANLAAVDALARERPALSRLPADGGWSAVLRLPATRTDEAWALELLERGVALHPGHFYDLAGGEHLVAGLVAEPATFAAGLAGLGALLAGG